MFSMLSSDNITKYLSSIINMLPPHIQQDINRYCRKEDRMSRAISRLMISYMGQKYLNTDKNILLYWKRNSFGRPFLQGFPVDISISHSELWIAVGMAFGERIGVDIEKYRDDININIFERFFKKEEIGHIKKSPVPSYEAIKRWSMREAILKADGRGLLVDDYTIQNIDMLVSPSGMPWNIKQVLLPKGCLYIAYEYSNSHIEIFEIDINEILSIKYQI